MNPKFWRIQQHDPVGVFIKTISMTAPVQRFDSLRLRGDGSCEEGSFTALVSALDVSPRDILVIEASEDNSTWTPLYSGVITAPGAKRSPDVSQVGMVGLSKRITETTVRRDLYPSADVASIVRELASEFLPSGVIYDAALIPNLTFTVGDVLTQYNYLNEVFDQLAASVPEFVVPAGQTYVYDGVTYNEFQVVPKATWGVGADRKFFFRRVTGSTSFNEASPDVIVDYETPSAEDICSKVVFYVFGGPVFEGGIEISDPSLVSSFGEVVKVFSVSGDDEETLEINGLTALTPVPTAPVGQPLPIINFSGLEATTNNGASFVPFTNQFDHLDGTDPNKWVRYRLSATGQSVTFGFQFNEGHVKAKLNPSGFVKKLSYSTNVFAFSTAVPTPVAIAYRVGVIDVNRSPSLGFNDHTGPFNGEEEPVFGGDNFQGTSTDAFVDIGRAVSLSVTSPSTDLTFIIEIRRLVPTARTIPISSTTALAASTFKAPVFERIDVRVPGVKPVVPLGTVNFAAGGNVTLDVADVDYRIAPEVGFETMFNLGQGVNAELIAQAALIERRANKSELDVYNIITRPVA